MKKIYLLLIVLLACFSAKAEIYTLGYCSDDIVSGVGSATSYDYSLQGAMQLTPVMLKDYVGDSLISVSIGFFNDGVPATGSFTVFIKNDLNSASLRRQICNVELGKWNVVELDEPLLITGEELFVGYYIKTSGNPMGVDLSVRDDSRSAWTKIDNEPWTQLSGYGNLTIKAYIETDAVKEKQYDLKLMEVKTGSFTRPGAEFSLSGTVTNMARTTVRDMVVECSSNGLLIKKDTITGINLVYSKVENFSVSGLSYPEQGDITMDVYVYPLDDVEDINPGDNIASADISITDNCAERVVLLENFTTAQCVNCPSGKALMHSVVEKYPGRVAWVSHHAGYYTDMYTMPESENLLVFFNGQNPFAPSFMFDRTDLSSFQLTYYSGSPVFSISSYSLPSTEKALTARLNTYSPVQIDITGKYIGSNDSLVVNVDYKKLQELDSEYAYLTVFLVEDSLKSAQNGWTGEGSYVHNGVLRHAFNTAFGELLDAGKDGYSREYNLKMQPEWKAENMRVIAFVGNTDYYYEDLTSQYVYNAAQADLKSFEWTSINNVISEQIRISVVNAEIIPLCNYKEFEVYNSSGAVVPSKGVSQGVYMVRITTEQGIHTVKCVVR